MVLEASVHNGYLSYVWAHGEAGDHGREYVEEQSWSPHGGQETERENGTTDQV
jgi:hypothetical protein